MFWEGKIDAKIEFWVIFCRCFFECGLTSILIGFLEARNLKNHCFPIEKSMIFMKSTFSQKYQKIVNFGFVFGGQNVEKSRKNSVENHEFFWLRLLLVFFRILSILARFWGAPGRPKINKNSKKSCSGRFWSTLRIFHRF